MGRLMGMKLMLLDAGRTLHYFLQNLAITLAFDKYHFLRYIFPMLGEKLVGNV